MLIMPTEKNICSKCYKNIQNKCEIICEICQCKFHKICAKLENENIFKCLSDCENIVFNCDNCLHSSRDLIKKISLLTYEIQNLKALFSQFVCNASKNNKSNHLSLPVTLNSNVLSNGSQETTTISFGEFNKNSFVNNNATGNIVNAAYNNSEMPSTSKKALYSVNSVAVNNRAVNNDCIEITADDKDVNNRKAFAEVLNDAAELDVLPPSDWSNVTNRKKKP